MPRYRLAVNSDSKADWTEDPAGTAWSKLDDNVEYPNAPTTGSDRITVATNSQISAQGVETFTLAGDEVVVCVRAWAYGKAVSAGRYYTVTLYDGATPAVLAEADYTSSSFGWAGATYVGSLTQAQIDALEVRVTSAGVSAGTLEVDAVYIEVVTHKLSGAALTLYNAIKALGSVGALWVAEPSGTVVPDHSANFRHGDLVGSAAPTSPLLTGGQAAIEQDNSVVSGILARDYKPFAAGSARTFLAVVNKAPQAEGSEYPTTFAGNGTGGPSPNAPHPTFEFISPHSIRHYAKVNTFPVGWSDIEVGNRDGEPALLDFEFDDASSLSSATINGVLKGTNGPGTYFPPDSTSGPYSGADAHYDTVADPGKLVFGYRGAGGAYETFQGTVEMVAVIERLLTPTERAGLAAAAGLVATEVIDREAPTGEPATYRARATHTFLASGLITTSEWVEETTDDDVETAQWRVVHPTKPWLDISIDLRSFASLGREARQSVAQPLGRSDPVVVADKRASEAGQITFRIPDDETLAQIRALATTTDPVLLIPPSTHHEPSRWVALGNEEITRIIDKSWTDERDASYEWRVVGRPSDPVESWEEP